MADSRGIEKPSATDTVEQTAHYSIPTTTDPRPNEEETPPNRSTTKSPSQEAQFWSILLLYTIYCIALSVILTVVIDGFSAGDSSTPRYIDGKLQLRVSDITTLVSAGLVVIKLLLTFWTGVAVWGCAYELTHTLNWDPTTVPGTTTVLVNSTNPLAAASLWYQYVLLDYVDERSQVFKAATGLASLPWSIGSTLL
ncbi:hypothetical protein BR93DRAFT_987794 [Coniochaeta sp. PMI_546]|nr:hypothetical protein BR93DRAFT_987794 [Coniochaeta sp. PMI_546]